MQKLVVATHNKGKLKEIKELLSNLPFEVFNADNFNIPEPIETGATFIENATLKAEHALPYVDDAYVLADDSGLEVEALGGSPGIYSARWGGENKDFIKAMQKVYDEITAKGMNPNGQAARFICTLALTKNGEETQTFTGIVEGNLTFPARGEKGFGYDPIFVPNGYTKTFAEIDSILKTKLSHRTKAFNKLLEYLQISTI
jgi:XTP/dITP diphosphohydrolase